MYEIEDVRHVIMHCPHVNELRAEMFNCFNEMTDDLGKSIIESSDNLFFTLLGKRCIEVNDDANREFNVIASFYISKMYRLIIRERQGIG